MDAEETLAAVKKTLSDWDRGVVGDVDALISIQDHVTALDEAFLSRGGDDGPQHG